MPQIGPYTLHSIETGRFGLDGGAMFGIVPKPLWSKRIEPDAENRIPLNMRCLLLEGADRVILIDVGVGDTFAGTKYEGIYAVDHGYADLDTSLAERGFSRADVTDVILTHLHFDHCGGSTVEKGGRMEVAFPNATYHVQRAHWNWANSPNPKEAGSFLERTFAPVKAAGQLHLLDGAGHLQFGEQSVQVTLTAVVRLEHRPHPPGPTLVQVDQHAEKRSRSVASGALSVNDG